MIEKLPIIDQQKFDSQLGKQIVILLNAFSTKINEAIDSINTTQKEHEAERFEIREWIDILEAVRKSVNIHEKQIDELQMKLEPKKCEPRGFTPKAMAEIHQKMKIPVVTTEPAEQIAKLQMFAENAQDETPRCPFCGEELSYAQEIDGGFEILTCNCSAGIWLFGNDKMWYTLEKLTKRTTND